MIVLEREQQVQLAEKVEPASIQWRWLPLMLAFSGIWYYGLWCLARKIL